MSFDTAQAQEKLAALTPEGRTWVIQDGFLDLVSDQVDESFSLGLGVVPHDEQDGAYLLARVVLFGEAFDEAEVVDEPMVLERAAQALNLPDGLNCDVVIEVYDGRKDESGQMVPVSEDEEGEFEVEAFEVLFWPEPELNDLDEGLIKQLIAGAPYILPTED